MFDSTDRPTEIRMGLVALGILAAFPLLVVLVVLPVLGGLGVWNGPGSSLSAVEGIGIALFALLVLGGAGFVVYRAIDDVAGRTVTPDVEDVLPADAGEFSQAELEEVKRQLDGPEEDDGNG